MSARAADGSKNPLTARLTIAKVLNTFLVVIVEIFFILAGSLTNSQKYFYRSQLADIFNGQTN